MKIISVDNRNTIPIRAACYVRMPTDLQVYSIQNQADYISHYAKTRGFEIVRTYADPGRSGLNIRSRPALQELLRDVESGSADYSAILVYDISRWGRFQDPDEAGACELKCRAAGVDVHYCAENFDNDGSVSAAIFKAVKRIMAGEYSRELSVKVHAGQSRIAKSGFHPGGPPGFGLRRLMVSDAGVIKGRLERGEHKSLVTDRIVLIAGPIDEVKIVRWIFRTYAKTQKPGEIAKSLNKRGIFRYGRPWNVDTIRSVLRSEKYLGNIVWNRTSVKLSSPMTRNPRENWVRAENAFEGIVAPTLFRRVQTLLDVRAARLDKDRMLLDLARLYKKHGYLTSALIDNCDYCKNSDSYWTAFGGLREAYKLVGYEPPRSLKTLFDRKLYENHLLDVARFSQQVAFDHATTLSFNQQQRMVTIEGVTTLRFLALLQRGSAHPVWFLRSAQRISDHPCIILRMDKTHQSAEDYVYFPPAPKRRGNLTLHRKARTGIGARVYPSIESLLANEFESGNDHVFKADT